MVGGGGGCLRPGEPLTTPNFAEDWRRWARANHRQADDKQVCQAAASQSHLRTPFSHALNDLGLECRCKSEDNRTFKQLLNLHDAHDARAARGREGPLHKLHSLNYLGRQVAASMCCA